MHKPVRLHNNVLTYAYDKHTIKGMSTVQVTFKIEKETKEELKAFAEELGVSTTAFITMVIKQALRDHQVLLTVEPELIPTPYLVKVMEKAEADYAADRDIIHTKGPEEALAFLDSIIKK